MKIIQVKSEYINRMSERCSAVFSINSFMTEVPIM